MSDEGFDLIIPPVSSGGGGLPETPLAVPHGGTGATTLPNHGVLLGANGAPISSAGPAASGQLLIAQGVSADPAFQPLSGDAALSAAGVLTIPGLVPTRLSSIIAIGHSWLAGNNLASTGTPQFESNGMLARLAGMLGVHYDNIQDGAISGSLLTAATNFLGTAFCGWSYAHALMVPPTSPLVSDATALAPNTGYPMPTPGLVVIVHGVNDFQSYNPSSATTIAFVQAAWSAALRDVISRARAGVLFSSSLSTAGAVVWDSAITFSGGTTTARVAANTGPAVRIHTANGDTDTITLPTVVPANFVVALSYIATANPLAKLSSASMNNTDVTTAITTTAASDNLQSNDIVYDTANPTELMKVTAGGGTTAPTLTRGFNGTTKTTHATNTIFAKYQGAILNFSGTAAAATGSLVVDGIGIGTKAVAVVKRFACTSADAGKTIIATVAGILASAPNQTVTFDSAWIEAIDAPMVVVANLPRYNYTLVDSTVTFTDIANFNAATASVCAEFDGSVQVADFDTPIFNRSGTINTTLNNTDVTTAGVSVTANGVDFPNQVGWVMNDRSEDMLVTAISGTYPNYTVTLTRGFNGTSKTTHASGNVVSDMTLWHTDHLHPNAAGHGIFAKKLYDAVIAMTGLGTYQVAHTAGNLIQDAQRPVLGIKDTWYLEMNVNANLAKTQTFTLNKLWYWPIFIPQLCILIGVAAQTGTTTAGTATAARMGLYDLAADRYFPSSLIQELGTVATTALSTVVEVATHKILVPGWYFFAVVNQGTTAGTVFTTTAAGFTNQLPYHMTQTVGSGGLNPFYSDTASITGALPASASPQMDNGPIPFLWPHLRTKHYA